MIENVLGLAELEQKLNRILPNAKLLPQKGLGSHSISLLLLDSQAHSFSLNSQQVGEFWQGLPYWAFAWAAGQGLAEYIIENPKLVAGKRVLDFGCGSGLVGIAAAKAGAASVLCCDTDPLALLACEINARQNNVVIETSNNWLDKIDELDCLLAGDVLYDLTSAGDLARQCSKIPAWIIAETAYQLPPWSTLEEVCQLRMSTLPKLEDFDQDLLVSIYHREGAINDYS